MLLSYNHFKRDGPSLSLDKNAIFIVTTRNIPGCFLAQTWLHVGSNRKKI